MSSVDGLEREFGKSSLFDSFVSCAIVLCLSCAIMACICCSPAAAETGAKTVNLLYATDPSHNAINVIDIGNNTTINTITGFSMPIGVTVSPDSRRVYVADSGSNSTIVIDTATDTQVARIRVGLHPYNVAVRSDGKKVYVTDQDDGTVSIIDTVVNLRTGTIKVGTCPRYICVNPKTGDVYVANVLNSSVSVIKNDRLDMTLGLGGYIGGMAITSDGSRLFVASTVSEVYVIDAINNTFLSGFNTGYDSDPGSLAFSPDGSYAYVACYSGKSIKVIATGNGSVVKSIDVDYPYKLVAGHDGVLYVASLNWISAIDISTGNVLHKVNIPVGDFDLAMVARKLRIPDSIPPVTTLNITGPVDVNGAFIGEAVCNLTAADNEDGSGVKSIEYYWPGSGWVTYYGPIHLITPGTVTLYYHAIDNAGNIETVLTRNITVVATQGAVTPTPAPCPTPTPVPQNATATPVAGASPAPAPSPGFETLAAVAGILAVCCVMIARRR